MEKQKIYLGKCEITNNESTVAGKFVEMEGENYYVIENYHEMPDFFISIVSDSNHWMFISSNGSLSAGRKDRNNALFPYYTVDKIHDYKNITGSRSLFLVDTEDKKFLWEPFTDESLRSYKITRNLYKNMYGNKIIFEEINHDLGLTFSYGWYNSDQFGFIKKSFLKNNNNQTREINILDGLQNILPYGVDYGFQNEYSNLLDAYKKNERIENTTLGLFLLSSIPVDKAEPSESLKATTVWSTGFNDTGTLLISDKQLNRFRNGYDIKNEYDIRASRGAYFINESISLKPGKAKEWLTVADINKDSADVASLIEFLTSKKDFKKILINDIERGTENLKKMVSYADGFQVTNTDLCYARHYTNTLFNIMRGGVSANNYIVEREDFKRYLWQINKLVFKEFQSWLDELDETISHMELVKEASKTGNTDLLRIAYEYLPLIFSRRHGDPSRPWNFFSIETKNDDGTIKYNYEGNWRDIFQNWEALSYSFPEFVEGIICKFVNASTIDGYNPYRIMRNGMDWESPDPDDPWAYIGYWGDHQIIYLQKLLEISDAYHPGKLDSLLTEEIFTYANVPYRIASYHDICKDPKNTVTFDFELDKKIKTEANLLGADASLLKRKSDEQIYKVNLAEKILVTLLSKLSNFIPEAGIWLNTQRPEWNDANNALVGNGTSMVTLYYLRRFLRFWENKFSNSSISTIPISEEVANLLIKFHQFFVENSPLLKKGFSDQDRKKFADYLGLAHDKFRSEIYDFSFSGEKNKIKASELQKFISLSISYIDQSISTNKRKDGLYHAYNLISLGKKSISIRNLYEMLEGQVAVLSSGTLSPGECLNVLNALKRSKMFREDQYSYLLYPDRELPRFTNKNNIPESAVKNSQLLSKLAQNKENSIIKSDNKGRFYFNGSFRNAEVLEEALNNLKVGEYSHLVEEEKETVLELYEKMFDHQSFTGRSGTFYGYEGLGSIYWHMVSKLLLAAQECFFSAIDNNADSSLIDQLKDHYYEIKAGIGLYKKPDIYGAFPTDAYSHTPGESGVKQPGLTGQVKEDIISRLGELGVRIQNGMIHLNFSLLNKDEILQHSKPFNYYSLTREEKQIILEENQLGFTFCQVPFIYANSNQNGIEIKYADGTSELINGFSLSSKVSRMIFTRNGMVEQIVVKVKNE